MFETQFTPRRWSALATITALLACVFAAGRLDAAVIVLWVPISPTTGISGTATIKAATPQRPLAPASTMPSVRLADRRYETDGTPLSSALIERRPAEQQLRPALPPHELLAGARVVDTDPDTYQLSADEQYRFFLETFDETNDSQQTIGRGDRLNEQPTEVAHPGAEKAYRVISDFARTAADAGSFHLIATVNTVHESARAELERLFAVADQWSRPLATVHVDEAPALGQYNTDSTVNADSTVEFVPAKNKQSDVTAATRGTSGPLAAPLLSGTADALKSVSAWLSDVSDSITARAKP